MAKCPKCDKRPMRIKVVKMDIRELGGFSDYPSVVYCCVDCDVVLSVAHDPDHLRSDIARAVQNRVGAGPR